MKSKVLFIILFSLILIGFLYITTIYAEELQSLNSQNTPAYTGNVVSTSTAVNIKYSTFNGTYSNSKSFSFSYPQGWKAINVAQLTNSEIAEFGLQKYNVTINTYLSCQNISKDKGANTVIAGYTGVENVNSKGVSFYASNFNIILNYESIYKIAVFDHIINSLKLYNQFVKCK